MGAFATERLTLRRMTAADAGHLLELDGDPKVMRFLGPPATSLAQVERQVLPRYLAVPPGRPDLGYRVLRREWGKGYATEGTLALLAAGLAD